MNAKVVNCVLPGHTVRAVIVPRKVGIGEWVADVFEIGSIILEGDAIYYDADDAIYHGEEDWVHYVSESVEQQ